MFSNLRFFFFSDRISLSLFTDIKFQNLTDFQHFYFQIVDTQKTFLGNIYQNLEIFHIPALPIIVRHTDVHQPYSTEDLKSLYTPLIYSGQISAVPAGDLISQNLIPWQYLTGEGSWGDWMYIARKFRCLNLCWMSTNALWYAECQSRLTRVLLDIVLPQCFIKHGHSQSH